MQGIIDFVKENAQTKIQIIEERHKIYGDNFKHFGAVASALFPSGVALQNANDWNRFGIVVQMLLKLTRYAENFNKGGHKDSLDDLGNYTTILQFLDEEQKQQGEK